MSWPARELVFTQVVVHGVGRTEGGRPKSRLSGRVCDGRGSTAQVSEDDGERQCETANPRVIRYPSGDPLQTQQAPLSVSFSGLSDIFKCSGDVFPVCVGKVPELVS